jgi:hypothetical protein
LSDTASRIADLESNFHELLDQLKQAFRKFRQESRRSAEEQLSTQSSSFYPGFAAEEKIPFMVVHLP